MSGAEETPSQEALERVFAALEADPRGDLAGLAARLGVPPEVVRRCQAAQRALSTGADSRAELVTQLEDTPASGPQPLAPATEPRSGGPWLPRAGDPVGPYTLIEVLGRGGMGQVWRARDPRGARDVAIKLTLGARPSPTALARLAREAEVAASLRHPGLVAIHAAGDVRGTPYLVLELVEGARSLDQVLPGLDLRARLGLVRDVARALGHAHGRGVVHRDVKPQNVLIDPAGRARVTDFGLALAEGQERLTRTGVTPGTPTHMAPEQLSGAPLGPPTDVWALGVVLYQAVCDALPFTSEEGPVALAANICRGEVVPPSSRAADVPAGVDAICARALARDPRERYPHGDALADDLERLLRGEPLAPGLRRSRRAWAGLVLVGAAGLAVVGAVAERGAGSAGAGPGVASAPAPQEVRLGPALLLLPPQDTTLSEPQVSVEVRLGGERCELLACSSADPAVLTRVRLDVGMTGLGYHLPLQPGANTLLFVVRTAHGDQLLRWRLQGPPQAPRLVQDPTPPAPPAHLRPGARAGEWTAPEGSVLVWLPPGVFEMGRDDGPPEEGPARFVRLTAGLFLARHEVTWGQYRRFCAQVGRDPPLPAHEVTDRHPVHGVSFEDARAYCEWAELRLPSEAEWEWAARGAAGRRYPWGDQPDPARVSSEGDQDGFPHTSPVGALPQGATPEGIHDLAGNVAELVSDGWGERHDAMQVVDPQGPVSPQDCLRGGAWDQPLLRCSATARAARQEGAKRAGFRVAW
mgnify:CR=1 FL=1